MGLAYGSDEFVKFLDTVMKEMANSAAQASALRAKDLGTFGRYNYEYISKSRFYNEVYTEETKEFNKENGFT